MPLPTPEKGETRKDFNQRCMVNQTMRNDYPNIDQRYAVCNSQYDETKKEQNAEEIEEEEFELTEEEFKSLEDLDLTPTESMASNAERGLKLRDEFNRGGTSVGVARARDIKNRKRLSPQTVGRMYSYFSRHEVDKKGQGWNSGEEGYPSAGLIAWLLWGGDSGKSWAESKWNQIKKIKED